MFTELATDPYFILLCIITTALCFFHYSDAYDESKKKGETITHTPLSLKKEFKIDFNTIEAKARVSITLQEKKEVEKMIEIFNTQYCHYSETRYNVQILKCINNMRNKTCLTYKFEFLN